MLTAARRSSSRVSCQPAGAEETSAPHSDAPPRQLWRWFLAFEAIVALVYFPFGIPSGSPRMLSVVPWMEWTGQVPAWAILGLSSVAAVVYGARRYRPNSRLAWWFIGLGVLLFITGDTIYKSWHQIIGNQAIPFPSFIDAIYITMYPVLAIGLMLLARSRTSGGDQASLLDALIITLGVGLLSWIFLIGPNVRASGGLLVRFTAAAYPLGDVLLLAMLAHLWSAGGLRNTAGRLLTIGTLGTLVADSVYGLAGLHAAWNWHDGNPFDLGWILFYACWGAAALHPSMRELSEPRPVAAARTSRARLLLLAVVALIAPVVLLIETASGNPVDAPAVAGVAAVMFVLVVMRMSGLVRDNEQAVAREQVLRRAAGELVAAPGRDDLYRAAIVATSELFQGQSALCDVNLAVLDAVGDPQVVAQLNPGAASDAPDMAALSAHELERLGQGRVVHYAAGPDADDRADTGRIYLCPLVSEGRLRGVISARTVSRVQTDLTGTLETLAAQVGLALDREALTETFHARRSEARFQTLVQNASDVILIARPDTTITYQTPSAQRILGYEPGSLEGVRLTTLLHPDDIQKAVATYTGAAFRSGTAVSSEWRIRHHDGSWRYVDTVANNLLDDPTVGGIVLTIRDVSERKNLEQELKHQAFHDALSGLANRALFRDRLEHALQRAARSSAPLAVLFLDVDDFKLVNDSLGHAAGDELLMAVAERISSCLRSGDTAARFGGDEFAILLEEIEGEEETRQVAERVIKELLDPFTLRDREVQVHVSIGIAYEKPGATSDPSEVLQAADVAMYAAKSRGKNRYEIYQPALQEAMTYRLERTAELQRAVDEGQFVLHYQPIVQLSGGEAIGAEALIRWNHPERGMLLPKHFINLAEETGLIIPIGRWVLQEACSRTRVWQDRYKLADKLKISVNISARHFQHDGLVDDVSEALKVSGLRPESLVLEITESLLVQDADSVVARMLELKMLGVSFAIDDFGTGYSSLSYLKRFPIDILKVDKSFVDDLGEHDNDGALTAAIVQIGKSLNLETVAEGIERARQVHGLQELGCQYGQGFFFAHPLSVKEMDQALPLMAHHDYREAALLLSDENAT